VTTTTYLPGAAPSNADEYTRCFVQAPTPLRLNAGVEWTGDTTTGASPSLQTTHGVIGVVGPPASSSSPRLHHPVALMSTLPGSDVQYRFYEEC